MLFLNIIIEMWILDFIGECKWGRLLLILKFIWFFKGLI